MKIIPAIDLLNGKCVRLYQGKYGTAKAYTSSPLDQAKLFEETGVKYLHIVDLDGAKKGSMEHLKIVESICKATKLSVDFGGGIRTANQIQAAMDAGCKMVNLGTLLAENIEDSSCLIQQFGADKLICAIDSEYERVKTKGWTEKSSFSVFEIILSLVDKGFTNFTVTDISRDGTLTSPSVELYQKILAEFPQINLRASGGVSSETDLIQLKKLGCEGTIVGKAYYEGFISLESLLKSNNFQ